MVSSAEGKVSTAVAVSTDIATKHSAFDLLRAAATGRT
jgi:hypothetical protein